MSSLKTTHRWAVAQQNPELEKELSAGLGIPGLVARIMVAHGITSIEEGQLFLTPSLDRDWADPLIIPGMSVVADRVERAIRNHERIAVFGDFDVDGITSTCLLTEALRTFGADVTPFIPHRFDEGYGLSRAALDRVNELARPQLIVTVDNGIAAKEEVSYLESLGIELVVTDHHEPSDQVPQGVPLTDPKLEDEGPSRELAGAGVALKLVQVLGERLGKPSYWRSLIEVAALGTVSDMMPLTPENRARLIRDLYRNDSRIEVVIYNELTGKVCRQLGIDTILRGLRNTVDFEYERNIMQVNQTLFPEIKTVLLFTPARYVAISSSVIRELVTFGGDPTPLMPENIDIKNYL